jgi:hypothetical protein
VEKAGVQIENIAKDVLSVVPAKFKRHTHGGSKHNAMRQNMGKVQNFGQAKPRCRYVRAGGVNKVHHTRRVSASLLLTMNTLVSRFASSSATHELTERNSSGNEDVSDAMWGSAGGFGNLGEAGVLSFNIPAVPDVRIWFMVVSNVSANSSGHAANLLPEATHRRSRRPFVQDQDPARYNYACFPFPRRSHCGRGFESYSRKLYRYLMFL